MPACFYEDYSLQNIIWASELSPRHATYIASAAQVDAPPRLACCSSVTLWALLPGLHKLTHACRGCTVHQCGRNCLLIPSFPDTKDCLTSATIQALLIITYLVNQGLLHEIARNNNP